MIDDLFTFPIVMVDVENEEKKQQSREALALPSEEEEEYDVLYGEAEYPYFDFIGLEDRWLPLKESLDKAIEGSFDACIVKFANVPPLMVPWSRTKFKKELRKFITSLHVDDKPKEEKGMAIIRVTADQLAQILANQPDEKKNE